MLKTIPKILREKSIQKDISELMFYDIEEMRSYFSISKKHTNLSFVLVILSCLAGIALLGFSVYHALATPNIVPAAIAVVGFVVSGLFAATSFAVYKKSISQLNHYYNALRDKEIYLLTIICIDKLSTKKQEEMTIELIRCLNKRGS